MPLLGQGQSRIPELTAEVAVRLIAFSFLLRTRRGRGRFSRELRIVVHPNEIGKIDRAEFQAFLRSLVVG
ncbi:macro domain-containing protein [Rhodococcus zopfii]|uniref:macro domain-containing protein n=1 Tax=Rhodococcus zopfii TaxID=43772 RepID=UPI001EDD6B33|nr:macro domain-containing protein [Rhodococcus zopfii]